ncbi:diguanylate cyclase/phosphodiesterase (GGDEF & EAL domains) with PAS/PAC sensor(s) [hydrothermal vent metagenome]|uniref:Diguanylate cyclase/phosphodiesterase (GGDEF & EAL domains) with PAS/PAC sensor(S) n=1 Tax=hydrothermal vent metagenome TaxID=652676 RepID=A0A3B0ZT90_9ZZZZ
MMVLTAMRVNALEKLDVLVIHSYHQEYPWTATQNQGFKKQLTQSLPKYAINFSTEYLNTKRIPPSVEYKLNFLLYIGTKYKSNIPDLIYVTDDNALNFLNSESQLLPWKTPVIFSGINNINIKLSNKERIFSGIFEYKDFIASISLAKEVSPNLKRIIFLGDGGVTDMAIKHTINSDEYREKNIEFIFINRKNLKSAIDELSKVNVDDSSVILTSVGGLKDQDGNIIDLKHILDSIAKTGQKILVMEDTYLHPGILGGYVTSGRIQGQSAAEIVSGIFRIVGEQVRSGRTQGKAAGTIIADIIGEGTFKHNNRMDQEISELVISWADLQRLNVYLPAETLKKARIINLPAPLVDQYPDLIKWLVWFLAILIIVLAGFSIRMRQKSRLVKEQYTDTLTNLPNRVKLLRDIRAVKRPSLAIIDINNFKSINNLYGLNVGDELLKSLGAKLQGIINGKCKLYRVGGNQFALMNKVEMSAQQFDADFNELLKEVQNNDFQLGELDINLLLTSGISRNEVEFLIPRAEQALEQAKKKNEDIHIIEGVNDQTEKYKENLRWAKKLNSALENDRIIPYFQLITNNKTGETTKYEALIRLVDDGEVISPFFFLEAAKSRRHYASLTKRMIEKTFQAMIDKDVTVSINFTVEDIRDKGTISFFKQKLNEYQVADKIIIELTESEGIENYHEVAEFITSVKELGCRVAIDDFGTGYSNFMHLIHLNVDYLKIDGSIIQNIVTDKNSEIIVKTIVDFTYQLGIETIAEFVDSQELLDKVIELGIDYSQGYFLGKPVSSM